MTAISTSGLTKDYGGGRGLFDLDLTVEEGEVFGFLGPNGAGKSTAIRLLMDMIRPTRGSATVLGRDSHEASTAVKALMGYLPGELPDFGRLRAAEVIGYLAGLRRVAVGPRVGELCARLRLDLGQPFATLSRGNKQKVGLVAAFMHEPRLLVLDEPTGGLDPLMQQEFYALVEESRGGGATVFLSSLVLSEVEHICDRAAVVREGRLAQVLQLGGSAVVTRRFDIEFAGAPPADAVRRVAGVEGLEVDGSRLRCRVRGPVQPLIDALAGSGVVSLSTSEPSLEETFLDLYRGGEPVRAT